MPLSRSPSTDSIYTLRSRDIQPPSSTSLQATTFSTVATTVAAATAQATSANTGAIPKYSRFSSGENTNATKPGQLLETPKGFSNPEYTTPEKQTYTLKDNDLRQSKTAENRFIDKTTCSTFQDSDKQTSQQQVTTGTHTNDDVIHMLAQATAMNSSLIHTLNDRMENMMLSDVLRPNLNQLLTKIPNTDGSSPDTLIEFIIEMDEITNLAIVPFHNLLRSIMIIVQGELRSFLATCAKDKLTWCLLKKKLLRTFLTRQQINRITLSRIFRYQKSDETLLDFAQDVHRVACALDSVDNDSILAHIWDSCNSDYLQLICHLPIPQTFEELRTIAKTLEDARQRIKLAQQRETEPKSTSKNLSASRT